LRAELEEQREFRLEQLEELGWAIETFEDEARLEVAYVLAMAAGSALKEIEAALERLATGAYGTCVSCGGPVGLERLEVLPMAALCAPCQYQAEPVWSASASGADRVPFAAAIRSR
jgi:RNA polymerase-binding transcription factor DksA